MTSIYFATFEKKREVRFLLPTQSKFLVFGKYRDTHIDIEIYKICVEVFGKTVSRTEMIDHSFERKFYVACHRLC